jgi:PKD repeat protein
MTYTGVYLYSGTGIKFVNYNGAFVRFNGDYTTYYYPSLIVKASDGTPIQGAAITVNTSAVNGFGKIQTTFYTDSNGKLYDSGNRSNWLAIPDQKVDSSATTSYVTKITATKNGKTVYATVDPSSSWYSQNPASLQGSEIVLNLDATGSSPVANFKSNISSGNAPLTVQFTDLSTGSPTSWKWNFGDGGSSTQQNPTHAYTAAGTYTVNLTASSASGANSKLATITVLNNGGTSTAPILPVANFNSNVTTGIVPLSVKFTDLSKNATGWNWSFGDGGSSTQQNPTHIYTVAGTYTVNLTVSNANGTNSKLATVTATAPSTPSQIPVATFSASLTSGVAPLSVTFSDQSTNSPTAWNWNFGDGTANSTVQNPIHTYSIAGNFTVVLTATNAAGSNTITKSKYITVITKPVAAFSAYPKSGTAPLKVQFIDRSTGSPTSWTWNFGDGTAVSTVKSPAHTYNQKGNYTVSLTITNAAGSNYIRKSGYIIVS